MPADPKSFRKIQEQLKDNVERLGSLHVAASILQNHPAFTTIAKSTVWRWLHTVDCTVDSLRSMSLAAYVLMNGVAVDNLSLEEMHFRHLDRVREMVDDIGQTLDKARDRKVERSEHVELLRRLKSNALTLRAEIRTAIGAWEGMNPL